ncbi:MAG: hypothetical protein Udaeo2_04350 [Candidatus Udaeobacter sp.]|nr:MAG: hypothetical protein Udaeo2_04350 [Candidatus Udaeobacter sp.]
MVHCFNSTSMGESCSYLSVEREAACFCVHNGVHTELEIDSAFPTENLHPFRANLGRYRGDEKRLAHDWPTEAVTPTGAYSRLL